MVYAMEHAFGKTNATWTYASVCTQLTYGVEDAAAHVMQQRLNAATAVLKFIVTDNVPPIVFGDEMPLALNSEMTTLYHHYKNGKSPKLEGVPVAVAPAAWESHINRG